jgi:hypothetical protein
MREKERIKKIIGKVERIWNKSPDQRFGQLIFNMMMRMPEVHKVKQGFMTGIDPFHIEDSVLDEYLDKLLETAKEE